MQGVRNKARRSANKSPSLELELAELRAERDGLREAVKHMVQPNISSPTNLWHTRICD